MTRDRRLNVVLIVMESVGAKWLSLYGGPHQNSLELERLADRGAVFDRAYASAPHTSSAMAALFCSVYPLHALRTITRVYPDLQIEGLPAVLAAHGYRRALMGGGNLVTGDHGETFGLHGKIVHGFEIYNEEVWVPLIISSSSRPALSGSMSRRQFGRSISLQPLLGILGYRAPAGWQGVDLSTQSPPIARRLFIFRRARASSNDLKSDPNEQRNLAASAETAIELARHRQHIETRIAFQNAYLTRFTPPPNRATP